MLYSSSSSATLTNTASSSSGMLSSPPNYIQLPPPPCFSAHSFSLSPSRLSPDPFDRTPTSPSIYHTAPSSPYTESPSSSAPPSPLKPPDSPPPLPALHITIPSGPLPQNPNPQDEPYPSADVTIDLALNDEGLSALEKIYLFSLSTNPFHRVFIVHAMSSFLEQVTPIEADEYVLPLLRGLALDDDETVKEALAAELVPIVWWFFTHCQIVPDDIKAHEYGEPSSSAITTICVQAFTPILGTLLLSPNPLVGGPARQAVVVILSHMRKADAKEGLPPVNMKLPNTLLTYPVESEPTFETDEELVIGLFGKVEREMFEQELLEQVIIGMGRLDMKATDDLQALYPNEDSDGEWSPPALEQQGLFRVSGLVTDDSPLGVMGASPDTVDMDTQNYETKTTMLEEPPNPYFPHRLPAPSPSHCSSSDSSPSTRTTSSTTVSSPSSAADSMDVHYDNGSSDTSSMVSQQKHHDEAPEHCDTHWLNHNHDMEEDQFYDAEYYLSTEVLSPPSRVSLDLPPQDDITLDYVAFDYPSDAALDIDDYGDELDVDEEQAAVGRVLSMSLMAATAASGTLREETKFTFVKEVQRVSCDPVHWVRREASFAVGALAKVAPRELVISSLLPLFESLRQDPVWHVRQSALFALPAVLSRLSPRRRRSLALETILPLSKDASTHVRSGVLEALGEVIYTFHEDRHGPPDQLLCLFLGRKEDKHVRVGQQAMDDPALATGMSDIIATSDPLEAFFLDRERPTICSFNFPAIVFTLGKGRWHDLREFYLQLTANRTLRVRRTLAASIGAIAKIIGEENTATDLLPVWWDAIRCEEEEVRMKAVECVGELLAASGAESRSEVLRGLHTMWNDNLFKSWRERGCIAQLLGDLAGLSGPRDAFTLRGLLMKALHDGVAAIREAAVSALPMIWRVFVADHQAIGALHDDVLSLARSPNHRQRMTFIACMHVMMAPMDCQTAVMTADDNCWLSLAPLARDKIVGVRIGVARFVGVYLNSEFPRGSHQANSTLFEIITTLQADTSHDVRSYVPHSWPSETTRVDVGGPEAHLRSLAGKASIFSKPPPLPLKCSSEELSWMRFSANERSGFHPQGIPLMPSIPAEDIGAALYSKLQHLGGRRPTDTDCLGYAGAFHTTNSELVQNMVSS